MADKDPPLKPLKKDRQIEDILNRDGRLMRSPVLWFFLLAIPILISIYVGLRHDIKPAPQLPQAVEYAPPEEPKIAYERVQSGYKSQKHARPYKGDAADWKGATNHGMTTQSAVSCNFAEWVGKAANADLQNHVKALGRPYRILPPGAITTQDFSPSRVNFDTDAGGIVTRAWCG